MDFRKFDTEEEFKQYYDTLNDEPEKQIEELAKWRQHQSKVVSKFIDQIKLIAGEQYSNIDHFLLELLQNADDNRYNEGVSPKVEIKLTKEKFTLYNNEAGFNAEDLFAITYSAYSPKISQKTAGTYIGEKGIGFKSIFAVADYVEIHSRGYHFRLDNDEFIIPHLIQPKKVEGTEISLKLKANKGISGILSDRLHEVNQEFTLFLQKIEKLKIEDQISGKSGVITTLRDKDDGYYFIKSGDKERFFVAISYQEQIPAEIVRTRFENLHDDLEREIIFAVPLPPSDYIGIEKNGKLFCFLPTEVETGTPIHVQIDAETTTNREDIVNFSASEWNERIFRNFVDYMVQTYIDLTQREKFRKHLPVYFPCSFYLVGNRDLRLLFRQIRKELKNQPIVLDRHGNFKKPDQVKILPFSWRYFYEDKYEKALGEDCTFVDSHWAVIYKEELESIDVKTVNYLDFAVMIQEGAPDSVNLNDDESVREFLNVIMNYFEKINEAERQYQYSRDNREKYISWSELQSITNRLKQSQIYPILIGSERKWGNLTDNVMWVRADSPRAEGSAETKIIDPIFTYSPGGNAKQRIKDFNTRFRKFLEDDLEISRYTEEEYLQKTTIKDLKSTEEDVNQISKRRKLNKQWIQIYRVIWNRKKSISSDKFGQIISEIADCKIPVRLTDKNNWELARISDAFLGPQFKTEDNLNQIYAGTKAPIIFLDFLQSIMEEESTRSAVPKRVNLDDWKKFLKACQAKTGPYLIDYDLFDDESYKRYKSWRPSETYKDDNNRLAQGIKQVIYSHKEYDGHNDGSFDLAKDSKTKVLDPYSAKFLKGKTENDFIARKLSEIWKDLSSYETEIKFTWGRKRKPRKSQIPHLLIREQIRNSRIFLRSEQGLKLSSECFEDDKFNRTVLGNLGSYVKVGDYDRDFLEFIGVKSRVDSSDLRTMIENWYTQTSPEDRMSESFMPFIESALQLSRLAEEQIQEMRDLPLYVGEQDELSPLSDWVDIIEPDEYPKEVVDELRSIFKDRKKFAVDELLNELFKPTELQDRIEDVIEILRYLGKHSLTKGKEEIRKPFFEKLETEGLCAFGKDIGSVEELPILWVRPPNPPSNIEVLPVQPDLLDDENLREAVEVLNLPTLSDREISVERSNSLHTLSDAVSIRIFNVFSKLTEDHNSPATKIKNLGLFDSVETVSERIVMIDNLTIQVNGTMPIKLPYWYDKEKLYVDSKEEISEVLPEFVDSKCGTTFSGTFEYIWNDPEMRGRSDSSDYTKTSQNDESEEHSKSSEGQKDDSGSQDRQKKESDYTNQEKTRSKSESGREKTRKQTRLYSYVDLDDQDKENEEQTKEKSTQDTEEIEKVGVKKLKGLLDQYRLGYRSVEAENKGYDFEVDIGEKTICIELKSTKDWNKWERVLTSNEFFTAKELGDRYFLCVIDQVLSDDFQIYFIQNPVSKINGFLFDAPWKDVAQ